jgi:NTP pyrophosphatase (non-canonical NTP hydrolase)
MNDKEYIQNALKTESNDFTAIKKRLNDEKVIRGLHAVLGMVTETAELADVFKKHLFYGKEIDWVNLKEETGDLFWYIAILVDVFSEESFGPIFSTNIKKLAKRYPNQNFSNEYAITRDLTEERLILEDGHRS